MSKTYYHAFRNGSNGESGEKRVLDEIIISLPDGKEALVVSQTSSCVVPGYVLGPKIKEGKVSFTRVSPIPLEERDVVLSSLEEQKVSKNIRFW